MYYDFEFCGFRELLCVQTCVTASTCVAHVFSLALFFCLLCPMLLFNLILFYYCSSGPRFFTKQRQNECGLHENVFHRHLKVWSPVGGSIWNRSGCVFLWKEVCHWEWPWGFQSPPPSQCPNARPAAMLPNLIVTKSPSETKTQIKNLLIFSFFGNKSLVTYRQALMWRSCLYFLIFDLQCLFYKIQTIDLLNSGKARQQAVSILEYILPPSG